MPIYEYECLNCYKRFEEKKSIASRKHADCPHCGQAGEQKITPVAFDTSAMGMDPVGFPTFAAKWAKRHEKPQ